MVPKSAISFEPALLHPRVFSHEVAMRSFVSTTFLVMVFAAPALSDQQQQLRESLDKLREIAVQQGNTSLLASFAMTDFAEAAGYVAACDGGSHEAQLSDMAERYATWRFPSLTDGLSGRRSDEAKRQLATANLTYTARRLSTLREGCDGGMLMVQRTGLGVTSDVFDQYLELPPAD
ncbi:hypothetical protein [Paracoccus sp. ME4]|uniref:hypothetical protein n=1 Tax=Paracoccus sp. ME4 TaxID=3138066 RepID=UPI00398B3C25